MNCAACGGLITAHDEIKCVAELSMKVENLLVTVATLRQQRSIEYDFISLVQTCILLYHPTDDEREGLFKAAFTALSVDPACLVAKDLMAQARQLVAWECSGRSGIKPGWMVLK